MRKSATPSLMPNHLSSIGFTITNESEYREVVRQLWDQAVPIDTKAGRYLHWSGAEGEEIWFQLSSAGAVVALNPHFAGKGSARVGIGKRIRQPGYPPLEGSFYGWAEPDGEVWDQGAYPFVFDTPDFTTYGDFRPPGIAEVQIAAFAHEIQSYSSPEAFDESQKDQEVKYASQSFIPSGLFGTSKEAPKAEATFTGKVLETALRTNGQTGNRFHWALVETYGGRFDVVIDPGLLPAAPVAGGILSGHFWLSGRLVSYPKREGSWIGRLFRGGG